MAILNVWPFSYIALNVESCSSQPQARTIEMNVTNIKPTVAWNAVKKQLKLQLPGFVTSASSRSKELNPNYAAANQDATSALHPVEPATTIPGLDPVETTQNSRVEALATEPEP